MASRVRGDSRMALRQPWPWAVMLWKLWQGKIFDMLEDYSTHPTSLLQPNSQLF